MSWSTGSVKKRIYSADQFMHLDAAAIGGKGMALFQLSAAGLPIPPPLCLGTAAYDLFVDDNSLREKNRPRAVSETFARHALGRNLGCKSSHSTALHERQNSRRVGT